MIDEQNEPKPPPPPIPRPWRRAARDLDRLIRQNTVSDYSDLIEIVGKQHFGEFWDPKPRPPEEGEDDYTLPP